MAKFYASFLFILIAFSCTKSKGITERKDIIGKWKMIKTYHSDGTSNLYYKDVKNEFLFVVFKSDGGFISNIQLSGMIFSQFDRYEVKNDGSTILLKNSSTGKQQHCFNVFSSTKLEFDGFCVERCGGEFVPFG